MLNFLSAIQKKRHLIIGNLFGLIIWVVIALGQIRIANFPHTESNKKLNLTHLSEFIKSRDNHSNTKKQGTDYLSSNLNSSLPVIRYIKPRFDSLQGKKEVNSDLKVYSVEGFAYTKDGGSIKHLTIDNEKIAVGEDDYFTKLLVLKPGENNIPLVLESDLGNILCDTLKVIYKKGQAKNYILSVAIDRYKHWQKLNHAVENANEFTNILIDKYNFSNSEKINIHNEDATAENIFSNFRKLVSVLETNDNLIVYFAGHGYYAEDIEEGYWVPYAGREDTPSDYLSNSEIINFIKALKCKHVLLLNDACFSGSLFASAERGSISNIHNLEKRPSRWAFSSGMIETVADDSPFCKYIIKYLNENNENSILFSDLTDYVIKAVGANSKQIPVAAPLKNVNHQGGQFVFYSKSDTSD